MYLPAAFRVEDPVLLDAFLTEHPLAVLVTLAEDGPTADHIPMRLERAADGRVRLHGHVARANPIHRHTPSGTSVLVLFRGEEHYITPSWYPSKRAHGKVVPTWNYRAVHVRGRIRWLEGRDAAHRTVDELTAAHEQPRAAPWAVDDAPTDYLDGMLAAIVPFEIEVSEMLGKFKASQNRNEEDRAGVREGLVSEGIAEPTVASLVRTP